MYEIAKVVVVGLTLAAAILLGLSIGQFIEVERPGSTATFNAAGYCIVGAFALSIACAIYDAGIKAGREDQETPPELLDKKE